MALTIYYGVSSSGISAVVVNPDKKSDMTFHSILSTNQMGPTHDISLESPRKYLQNDIKIVTIALVTDTGEAVKVVVKFPRGFIYIILYRLLKSDSSKVFNEFFDFHNDFRNAPFIEQMLLQDSSES